MSYQAAKDVTADALLKHIPDAGPPEVAQPLSWTGATSLPAAATPLPVHLRHRHGKGKVIIGFRDKPPAAVVADGASAMLPDGKLPEKGFVKVQFQGWVNQGHIQVHGGDSVVLVNRKGESQVWVHAEAKRSKNPFVLVDNEAVAHRTGQQSGEYAEVCVVGFVDVKHVVATPSFVAAHLPVAPTTLKVGVWNGASEDTYGFDKSAMPADAVEYFTHHKFSAVICPEGANAFEPFRHAGFAVENGHEANTLCMCYDPRVLKLISEVQEERMRGGGKHLDHNGSVVFKHGKEDLLRAGHCYSCWFEQVETGQKILITAVHAGHYDRLRMWDTSCEHGMRAARAMATIRSCQEKAGAQGADKVIVAGDFNELGLLIEKNHDFWNPLPNCVPKACCTNVGETHFYGQLDVIAVGGNAVHSATLTYDKLDKFGSDHNGVSMYGV